MEPIAWPDGKRFAFTVFDDPDGQSLSTGHVVYGLLRDLGLRTTKGVWTLPAADVPSEYGITCGEPAALAWFQELQKAGFEIGYHNATLRTSPREDTELALRRFAEFFGDQPITMAQHYDCDENVYWGDERLTGWRRGVYNLATRFANHHKFKGSTEGHPYYWADLCHTRVQYLRNFVFGDINTLKSCPMMPYHDPRTPLVRFWYASSGGANVTAARRLLHEANQDRLEAEGGACILYTHFGHGYVEGGAMDRRVRDLLGRLSRKNGWFAPVATLLTFLRNRGSPHRLTDAERRALEWKWLREKLTSGTA
jgi:hypothetical protein